MIDFQLVFGIDKLMHFMGFTGLSTLTGLFILIISGRNHIKSQLKVVWFTMVTIGIIEEYRQYFDPDRSTEFLDALANIAGVTTGVGITSGISYFLAHKQQILSNLFRLYPMVLIMLLIGLIYLNEKPFLTLNVPFQARVRDLAAMIGL